MSCALKEVQLPIHEHYRTILTHVDLISRLGCDSGGAGGAPDALTEILQSFDGVTEEVQDAVAWRGTVEKAYFQILKQGEALEASDTEEDARQEMETDAMSSSELPSPKPNPPTCGRMIPSEAEFPNGVSPRRRTALSIDRVGTKATETRRGSLVPRPIGERTESPERSRMGRRMTRIKTQKFLGTDLRIPRGRAESLLYTYGEDDDLQPSSRRPSSLPGGLNSLESSGSGLGYYFKDQDFEGPGECHAAGASKPGLDRGSAEGFDFSRLIFDKFKNEAEPEFLQDLTLEVTGGLNMVAEIPLKEKYLWFIVLLVSVVFNVSYLLHLDWAIFKTYLTEVFGTFDPRLIADRLSNGGGSESRKEIQAQLLDDKSFKASIFGLISDQQTRMMIVNAAVMVAIWEVAWLCFQFATHQESLSYGVRFGDVSAGGWRYKRFNAVGYFFQKLLPQVSTFSAVKLLARVHPSLLSHEYRIWVSESSEKLLCGHRRNTIGYVMLTITFVIFNICCAMASVSAFSVKMLAVSFKLVNPEVPTWLRLASILATLNQVVGAVYLERVLQDRIFLFVFGGRDATYEDDELAYRNAYETRLMKEIWVQYWHKKNPATGCRTWPQTALNALNAVVLLATLDHYDLQYLMVEDPEGEMDLFERLGLVESSQDAPQRSVSAQRGPVELGRKPKALKPDDLSPSKRKKSNQSNVHKEKQDTSTCASLCNLLPCAAPVRVSSPELRAVPEELGPNQKL
eukprot:g30141.t1